MTETYFNVSVDGNGMEGFMNWANTYVDGWLINSFIFVVFVVSISGLFKSDNERGSIVAFVCLVCSILIWILKLFLDINEMIIFILGLIMLGAIFYSSTKGR